MFGKLRNIRHTMNLGDSCYQLGDGDSSAAYGGFAPDDVVWVIGTWDDEALHAEAVFDGTPERYASSLEHWAWLLLLVTALGLGVFAAGLHLIVTQIPCPTHRRRKAEKIRVWPGETDQRS